jgi:hypothetical protein
MLAEQRGEWTSHEPRRPDAGKLAAKLYTERDGHAVPAIPMQFV